MKFRIYLLALCLLLVLALASLPAAAYDSSVVMPVTTSFRVSSVAKATDNALGDFSPGPGKIDITSGDYAIYVRLTGPAGNGTRLSSLDDYESGIVFRNNTFLLPLHIEGKNAGTLILMTDNLTADSDGYTGIVTGIQLDSGKTSVVLDGQNYTASAILSLTDLPAGATYRLTFTDNSTLVSIISTELEASGLTAAPITPLLEVSAGKAASGNAINFVIVTIETGGSLTGLFGGKNFTFYRYADGELSSLQFTAARTAGGGIVFQAISPGAGQFMIVAPTPCDLARDTVSAGGIDIFLLGGLLAVLVIALAVMVRRVIKR